MIGPPIWNKDGDRLHHELHTDLKVHLQWRAPNFLVENMFLRFSHGCMLMSNQLEGTLDYVGRRS